MTKFLAKRRGITGNKWELWFTPSFTTTNATPVLIDSFPVATNTTLEITTHMAALKSDGTTRNVGAIKGVFHRVAADVSQDGTLDLNLSGVLSTAKISYSPNNTTHAVEVYANGTTATINWKADIEVRTY
jgi:hypothetical protein